MTRLTWCHINVDNPSMFLVRLFFFSFCLLDLCACTTPPDRVVVANVDKEEIRAGDLKKALAEEAGDYGADLLNNPEGSFAFEKQILNGLIEKKLLLRVAQEKKIALTPEEETRLKTRLQSGYEEISLDKSLEARRVSLEAWMGLQREKEVIEKLLQQEVYSRIQVDEGEMEDFYKRNAKGFRQPDRIDCRHIVTAKKEKAGKILSLLDQGGNFASLATRYSESPDRKNGGDLGYIARGEGPAVFDAACFTLSTGQTSRIVPSEYGFHIFRVVDKRPGRGLSLAEARPEIVKILREMKGKDALREWLDDVHRQRPVVIHEEALKMVLLPPQAVKSAPETGPASRQSGEQE